MQMLLEERRRTGEEEGGESRIESKLRRFARKELGGHYLVVPFIPGRVAMEPVLGLVEAMGEIGCSVQLSTAPRKFKRSPLDFALLLTAAEEIGFVTRSGNYLDLTDLGLGYLRASNSRISIVRARLSGLEPFKTALELLSSKRTVSASEIARSISQRYYFASAQLETGEEAEKAVLEILIGWALSTELLNYNGKTGQFSLNKKESGKIQNAR